MGILLREQLTNFLTKKQAHMTLEEAVADFPMSFINKKPPQIDYTPWDLLEHIRLTQRDLIEFMETPTYKEPVWPVDYWPKKDGQADKRIWDKTMQAYRDDVSHLVAVVNNPGMDLFAKVKNGNGQIVLREILLAIDHTAYHIGEFAILRQVMGTWPESHKE